MSMIALGMPGLRRADPDAALDTSGRPDTPALVDRFGRVARDLRISLTSACSLRCTYCMPAEGLPVVPRDELLSAEEIALIEADVNAEIRANAGVSTRLMTPDDAVAAGALALFGEKYGDEVRVLSMGRMGEAHAYSVELCGGTHVRSTGDIALFKIVSESAVSSGIRRIEALTGDAARLWLVDRDAKLRETAAALKASPDEVPARVAQLVEDRRRLERELADAKKALALGGGAGATPAGPEQVAGVNFIGQVLDGLDPKALRGAIDEQKARIGSGVIALVAINEGRASIAVGVTDDLSGGMSAVDLVRAGVAALGGQGGGGRPDMAQGGGPDGDKGADAIAAVKDVLAKAGAAA